MKRIALYAAALALISMTAVSCSSSSTTSDAQAQEAAADIAPAVQEAPAESGIVNNLANDDKFRPDTKVEQLTILDFNATWCVPCKKLTPAFDKAAEAYKDKAVFYSVDIERNPQTAEAFGITGVPTVIFLTPSGNTQTYVGLDPFCTADDQSAETIYTNMSKLIDAAL